MITCRTNGYFRYEIKKNTNSHTLHQSHSRKENFIYFVVLRNGFQIFYYSKNLICGMA